MFQKKFQAVVKWENKLIYTQFFILLNIFNVLSAIKYKKCRL